jgi:hypothetical protein
MGDQKEMEGSVSWEPDEIWLQYKRLAFLNHRCILTDRQTDKRRVRQSVSQSYNELFIYITSD